MIDPDDVPLIESQEQLARFVVQSSQFRVADSTVKPDLFVPYPQRETSVTRLRELTPDALWIIGRSVAHARGRTLYGRSDVKVSACVTVGLRAEHRPLPGNANHADIIDWPAAKEDQKSVALKLVAHVSKLIKPPPTSG